MRFLRTAAAAMLLLCAACAPPSEDAPSPRAEDAPPMAHGDHDAKYGGTVWMHDDLHFEVVLSATGEHHVYFSDAYRVELPASVATDVHVTILRTEGEPEPLELVIDEFGESWVAKGRAVEDLESRAVVTFVHDGEPYEIDLPFASEPMDPNAPDPHVMP